MDIEAYKLQLARDLKPRYKLLGIKVLEDYIEVVRLYKVGSEPVVGYLTLNLLLGLKELATDYSGVLSRTVELLERYEDVVGN